MTDGWNERTILHLDMDAFFASVEQRDNPELRGKPVVVGGETRGVVAAASYEARAFGIRSAMPSARAKRLCPHVIFVSSRFGHYSEASRQVMDILRERVPVVEQTSVDEAYLDASGMQRLVGSPRQLAMELKQAIRDATQLTASVGVAPNKFLAKISSDMDKPNGLFVLEPKDVPAFLEQLPVGKIPGVGPRAKQTLHTLGIRTAADIGRYPEDFWTQRFGTFGRILAARGLGLDDRPVESGGGIKSVSGETTFDKDTADRAVLEVKLWSQAERVGTRLRKKGLHGRTVTLKLKYSDFTSITRSKSLALATQSTRVIFEAAAKLLAAESLRMPVRLIGVGVGNLEKSPQLSLLPQAEPDKLEAAVDAIRHKFGHTALVTGRGFGPKPHKDETS
ncbi:MAG: DNA polymerase IV [Okeania sp. SIO3B3]|nr:DNA polymerase IV [Okeania sp. SIO3B3]